MDEELFQKLARQAGLTPPDDQNDGLPWWSGIPEEMHRFAELVAEECCATIVEATSFMHEEGDIVVKRFIAAAIRAKFTSPGQNLLNPGDRKEEPAVREGAAL